MFLDRVVEFIEPLTDQGCKDGESVKFSCLLNFDDVEVTWYKNGSKLLRSRDVIITSDGPRHHLTFNNVTGVDVGIISLRAENLKVFFFSINCLHLRIAYNVSFLALLITLWSLVLMFWNQQFLIEKLNILQF